MKRFVVVPDSFKGTISSVEICEIAEAEIKSVCPGAEVKSFPVADGGEGSVDAFLYSLKGEKCFVPCCGPRMEPMQGFFGMLPNSTAIVEMAAAAGLPLVGEEKHPELCTTFGVGQLILAAAKAGAKTVIVGLGGSATNDGGAGALAALGVKFYNAVGEEYVPTGKTLHELAGIDKSGLTPLLRGTRLIAMCDVDNPLCGEKGASFVYGPQKGADPEMVKALDANLAHFADVALECTGVDHRNVPGAGAAGGMGFGLVSLLGGELKMGIETVLNVLNFDEILDDTDLVLTGEGKLDSQSLRGKVVVGVARKAKEKNVPVVAVVGDIGENTGNIFDEGVSYVVSTNRMAIPFSQAKPRAKEDLRLTVNSLMHFLKAIHYC